ncbi:MAG TPA: GNAT family N-acetyltransferase [Candidatus Dormibacteraeota bacterium]
MTTALAAPSPLRHGEVALLPLDATAPALLVAASYDEEVTRWTSVPRHMTLLDARMVTAGWASNRSVVRLQVCLPDLAPAGMVTVWINNLGEAEVGYWLLEGARGRGVARRAVRMLCDWALATCDLERLHLTTLPGNTSSERVATACGFRPAGTVARDLKGDTQTMRLWVRTADGGADAAAQHEAAGT